MVCFCVQVEYLLVYKLFYLDPFLYFYSKVNFIKKIILFWKKFISFGIPVSIVTRSHWIFAQPIRTLFDARHIRIKPWLLLRWRGDVWPETAAMSRDGLHQRGPGGEQVLLGPVRSHRCFPQVSSLLFCFLFSVIRIRQRRIRKFWASRIRIQQ